MRRSPPVDLTLGASRLLAAWIAVVAGASMALVILLPVSGWLRGFAALVVVAWAGHAVRRAAWRGHPQAVCTLRVDGDRVVHALTRDGQRLRGRILDSSYVGAGVTTVVWRADGEWRARTEVILQDAAPTEARRRLRVQLRYGRSDDSAGFPASHA